VGIPLPSVAHLATGVSAAHAPIAPSVAPSGATKLSPWLAGLGAIDQLMQFAFDRLRTGIAVHVGVDLARLVRRQCEDS